MAKADPTTQASDVVILNAAGELVEWAPYRATCPRWRRPGHIQRQTPDEAPAEMRQLARRLAGRPVVVPPTRTRRERLQAAA